MNCFEKAKWKTILLMFTFGSAGLPTESTVLLHTSTKEVNVKCL